MMTREQRLQLRLVDEVVHTKERIFIHPKQGIFNFRCYENCVQYCIEQNAIEKNSCEVHEVIYIDSAGENPILHYVVKQDGKFLEVSMGFMVNNYCFFHIRKIDESYWQNIGYVFNNALNFWTRKYTNWIDRYILRIDRLV